MSRLRPALVGAWIPDALLFFGSLGLYTRTLAPTFYLWDSAELAAGAWTLGIVHPTGYPLYLLLAKGFMLLVPIGDAGYRANLFSAVCAAVALVVLRRAIALATGAPWCALGAVAFLGVSFPVWSSAVAAEVYTLHAVFIGLLLWLGLRWRATGHRRDFLLGALVLGLSFGNHMSTSLLLPAVAFFVWRTVRRQPLSLATWIQALALSTLGPLTYLYLPLRYAAAPALNWVLTTEVDLTTLEGLLWMVRGRMFNVFMFWYGPRELLGEILGFGQLLWRSLLGVGVAAAALGLSVQARRDGTLAGTLGLQALCHSAFFVNYSVMDKNTMFMPVFLVLAFWVGEALTAGVAWLAGTESGWRGSWLSASVTVVLVGSLAWSTYPRVDLSRYDEPRRFGERVLREVPRDALIVGFWLNITPLIYLQSVEGLRPDVEIFDWGWYALARQDALFAAGVPRRQARAMARELVRDRIEFELATGRTVLALEDDDVLSRRFTLEPRGDIFTLCAPAGCE
ncbi:MAG: protein O-mannosyl-transferase family [Candidatus Rokuibacteriota bacterium]